MSMYRHMIKELECYSRYRRNFGIGGVCVDDNTLINAKFGRERSKKTKKIKQTPRCQKTDLFVLLYAMYCA